MALVSIDKLSTGVMLGIWRVEEEVAEILSQHPHLQSVADRYGNPAVCREKMAHYSLLYAMTGNADELISHDGNGKPIIKDFSISISDTRGFVAILLAKQGRVGVDIEYNSDRVSRIASRFIRPDEETSQVESQLLNWTVKEAVYKYFSELHLDYFDMRLHAFRLSGEGCVTVDNLKQGGQVTVRYRVTDDYTISYLFE